MHAFSALLIFLFSFSHATSVRQAVASQESTEIALQPALSRMECNRRRSGYIHPDKCIYAERGCASQRKTNTTFSAR